MLPRWASSAEGQGVANDPGENDPAREIEKARERIERLRKGDFVVRVTDPEGNPVSADLRLRQTRNHFHFGTAVSRRALDPEHPDHDEYVQFILKYFNTIVAENAMKWYHVERERDDINLRDADRIMEFARAHDLAVRGHCLLWDVRRWVEQQEWMPQLESEELREKVQEQLARMVSRYAGELLAWDVNNEMLDGGFYEERLGDNANAAFFKTAHEIDLSTPLFLNEFMILEDAEKTERYVELANELQARGAPVGGIGIQDHFAAQFSGERDFGGVFANLDRLAELDLPIHITELSFNHEDPAVRAKALENAFTLLFSHPSVEAILVLGFWGQLHWLGDNAALVEKDWSLNPAGETLQQLLLEEWRTSFEGSSGSDGTLKFRGFFGVYEAEIRGDERTFHAVFEFTPETLQARHIIALGAN